jgi:hypothetical protein
MTGTSDKHVDTTSRNALNGLDAEDSFIKEHTNECRELVHSERPSDHDSSDSVIHAAHHAGDQPRDVIAELDMDAPLRSRCPRDRRVVAVVRHVDKDTLFNLCSLPDRVRMLLASFLARRKRNKWMQDQRMYVQEAALAAGYSAMGYGGLVGSNEYSFSTNLTAFDGHAFLNCGSRVKTSKGTSVFIRCHQRFECRACNLAERLKPAKDEFLPRFNSGVAWYGLTIVGVSDPCKAGVKMRLGYHQDGTPIDKWLFRLSEHATRPPLPKYSMDDHWFHTSHAVAEAVYQTANYLTNNGHFDGLHAVPEVGFRFFPNSKEVLGVGHTANFHIHAYGNTSKVFTEKLALQIFKGAINRFEVAGALDYAYPDILLRRAPTAAALETAMNYAIKPKKLAETYIDGLTNGCPVSGLNYLFHQVVYGVEQQFPVGSMGAVLGNMSMKSGHRYIGRPPLAKMSPTQVEQYLAKSANDDVWAWEIERYERHLEYLAKQRKRGGEKIPESLEQAAA